MSATENTYHPSYFSLTLTTCSSDGYMSAHISIDRGFFHVPADFHHLALLRCVKVSALCHIVGDHGISGNVLVRRLRWKEAGCRRRHCEKLALIAAVDGER